MMSKNAIFVGQSSTRMRFWFSLKRDAFHEMIENKEFDKKKKFCINLDVRNVIPAQGREAKENNNKKHAFSA